MAALTPTRTLLTAIWLLAVITLTAACGADAPAPPAASEVSAPTEAPASPAPVAAHTATPTAVPTTVPPTSEPSTPSPTSPQPTAAATPAPTPGPITPPTASLKPRPTPDPRAPTPAATTEPPPPAWSGALTYQVVATHPHDTSSFTQGLVWFDGLVYEGTGLRGQSVLRIIDLPTGRVIQ